MLFFIVVYVDLFCKMRDFVFGVKVDLDLFNEF